MNSNCDKKLTEAEKKRLRCQRYSLRSCGKVREERECPKPKPRKRRVKKRCASPKPKRRRVQKRKLCKDLPTPDEEQSHIVTPEDEEHPQIYDIISDLPVNSEEDHAEESEESEESGEETEASGEETEASGEEDCSACPKPKKRRRVKKRCASQKPKKRRRVQKRKLCKDTPIPETSDSTSELVVSSDEESEDADQNQIEEETEMVEKSPGRSKRRVSKKRTGGKNKRRRMR